MTLTFHRQDAGAPQKAAQEAAEAVKAAMKSKVSTAFRKRRERRKRRCFSEKWWNIEISL